MKEKVTQNADEMSMADERVAGLLGGLKRVEAPAGFEFRVRSAITGAKSAAKVGFGFRQVLLYAAPLLILAAIGLPLAFYFAGDPAERTAANVPASTQPDTARSVTLPEVSTPGASDTSVGRTAAVNSPVSSGLPREPAIASRASNTAPKVTNPASGGSYVEASREGKRILPKGLDPAARTPERPEDFSMNARITAKDVLSTLGINAKLEGSAWKVESVIENSTAARAGLKPGDIVKAINDQTVTGSTEFRGKVSGKSIRIIRDGKEISVELPRR